MNVLSLRSVLNQTFKFEKGVPKACCIQLISENNIGHIASYFTSQRVDQNTHKWGTTPSPARFRAADERNLLLSSVHISCTMPEH
jgi:hypothetical protein